MSEAPYDAAVIGGGITGAGVARDLSLRGLKVVLIEKGSPGSATTAASSHLIHGGLRYLLYDRLTTKMSCWDSGNILRIAEPLLKRLTILWPVYKGHAHGIASVETLLEVYDRLQIMKGGLPHRRLSSKETLEAVPGLEGENLVGAVSFDEWWVDPVSLVEANLSSAKSHGATIKTGHPVSAFIKEGNRIVGVRAGGEDIRARLTINASGPWVDEIAGLTGLRVPLRLQKGTHLVYDKKLLPTGLLLQTPDRRYIFVIPSERQTLVGPTDIAVHEKPDAIKASDDEIRYLSDCVSRYLPGFPRNHDRTIVGARPILGQKGNESLLSRGFEVLDHAARDGVEGFITIGGGKMSDFRLMAEAAADRAVQKLGVKSSCLTMLEALDGRPVQPSAFKRPESAIEDFLKRRPRLRKLHAQACLALAFLRHALRRK